MLTRTSALTAPWARRATQKVVVVNGNDDLLKRLEFLLDAGHYDIVFAANLDHAYSEIKKTRPDLVILCLALDDPIGFQVLSMLKLDADTADIPLLTCTTDDQFARPDADPEDDEPESELPAPLHTIRLN
jgi:twitching motility two-component system response regulator PilH